MKFFWVVVTPLCHAKGAIVNELRVYTL